MSVQIVADAVPIVTAERVGGHSLRIACPFCRHRKGWRKGKPKFHWHGTGGMPGPWHRLAHCVTADLPKHLQERRRDGGSLSYELVEVSEPRVNTAPPLAPGKSVLRVVAG